jgi:hypothetical protein
MALMSGKVYSNTGAPNNADGVNGDIYMQLDGFKTTYRKEGGAWVAVGSTFGAIPEFVSGVGAPSNFRRQTANTIVIRLIRIFITNKVPHGTSSVI